MSHPHNPTGTSFGRAELKEVARLAERHGVTVISDEVHAPMTMPGTSHVPYLSLGEPAAASGVTVTSASKAFNLAGLKSAVMVTSSVEMHEQLTEKLPPSLPFHAGHLGVLASVAAFEHGGEWLDALVAHLDRNRALLCRPACSRAPGGGLRARRRPATSRGSIAASSVSATTRPRPSSSAAASRSCRGRRSGNRARATRG